MIVLCIIVFFFLVVVVEIGGVWFIWQVVKEDCGWLFVVLGVMVFGVYGFVVVLQLDVNFGWVLVVYGGIFIVGLFVWGVIVDGFCFMIWDVIGFVVVLVGVVIIIFVLIVGFFVIEIVG